MCDAIIWLILIGIVVYIVYFVKVKLPEKVEEKKEEKQWEERKKQYEEEEKQNKKRREEERKNFTNQMFELNDYGNINNEHWKKIMSMKKQEADSIMRGNVPEEYWKKLKPSADFIASSESTLVQVFDCVWFYATYKPYLVDEFEKAKEGFYSVYNYGREGHFIRENENIEVFLAELYAICQMGADSTLKNKVTEFLEKINETIYQKKYDSETMRTKVEKNISQEVIDKLTILASGLMWMKAYDEEKMILQYMVENKIRMSEKLQERLYALSNGGENAPSDYNVYSNQNQIYLDTASLAWNDNEYNSFFENLSFKEKVLTYSLAIRDENKDLFITQAVNLPDNTKVCSKLMKVFQEEYGSQVVAKDMEGIALSGSGSEKIPGILVRTRECKQLGIFVHIARIGKKLNIKFYTLFMPTTNDITEQKQQVISLYKKLSPNVTMWENSLKDTILMAIQQLLNATPNAVGTAEAKSSIQSEDEPVEF